MDSRFALLIGNSEYDNPKLAKLKTPEGDVQQLAKVLADEKIGRYEVETLINEPSHIVRAKVSEFFRRRRKKDVLLLYFAGHGVKNSRGELYLTLKDTDVENLEGTGIEAPFITGRMDDSRSCCQILVLDCCHAAAVIRGTRGVDNESVGTAERFEGSGQGRIIMAATDAFQYAFDGDEVIENVGGSVYTKHLIQGLSTGKADTDEDGFITIDEIAQYVYERVKDERKDQTPSKFVFEAQGDIIFAWNRGVSDSTRKLKKCFVISPLSANRSRADAVFGTFLEPACKKAGFRSWRSDMQLSQKILPEVMGSLRSDPMVIAYLGEPAWNPNVMIEVGYRLSTGRPIVLVREKIKSNKEPPLPFDLQDHRVIFLPDSQEQKSNPAIVEDTIKNIALLLKDRKEQYKWDSPHAVASVRVDLNNGTGEFLESSKEADRLFDVEMGLSGLSLEVLIDKLKECMSEDQFDAFAEEQATLISRIAVPAMFRRKKIEIPVATRPIVFKKHNTNQKYINRAYLPIVVQYSKQGAELWLKLLYLDVTTATKPELPDGNLYVCRFDNGRLQESLDPSAGPLPAVAVAL